MKYLDIIGAGTGPATITAEAAAALKKADILFGAPRLLEDWSNLWKASAPVYTPAKVAEYLKNNPVDRAAVLVSGDTGFFSAAVAFPGCFPDRELRFYPGISSMNYFFARLQRPWQAAELISCHGREGNLADTVRRNALTFALTGNNSPALAAELVKAGFGGLKISVGENLGRPEEQISFCTAEELVSRKTESLTVILVENPAPDARVRCGINDEEFIRGKVPMTKAEVRAVTMSMMAVAPEDVCWDIGAGTGSCSVEMALAAYKGHVWAVDRNEEAVSLIGQNAAKFHIGNITNICGSVPEILSALPTPDKVFVGGSGGYMKDIFSAALALNPKAEITVNTIALESIAAAMEAYKAFGMEPEIVQMSAARSKTLGGYHMMMGQNPIYILKGRRPE